jgi:cytochrome c oxidase subunit 2
VRRIGIAAAGSLLLVTLAGCSADTEWGRLGMPAPVTEEGQDITLPFWQNAWILAWIVGGITWALMGWVALRYRRKSDDELPRQLRYNMPLEALYTFTPVVIVLALFFFTARDSADLTRLTNDSQHTVGVIGYKWAWAFNYVEEGAYDMGTPEVPATLWLPVDEKTRFTLTSPDVIHDFWVPAFLFKMDVVPGRENQFELTPNTLGTYAGKCAELCGVDHSRMLFTVKVVPRAEYEAHIADLKAHGQGGQLDTGRIVTTGVQQ